MRAVIGERWMCGAVAAAGADVVGVPAATVPPGELADAAGAAMTRSIKLLRNALRVRTRKTTTSFVGLRG